MPPIRRLTTWWRDGRRRQARGNGRGEVAIRTMLDEGHPEVAGILSDDRPIETFTDRAAEGERIERLGDHAVRAHVEVAAAGGGLHLSREKKDRPVPRC